MMMTATARVRILNVTFDNFPEASSERPSGSVVTEWMTRVRQATRRNKFSSPYCRCCFPRSAYITYSGGCHYFFFVVVGCCHYHNDARSVLCCSGDVLHVMFPFLCVWSAMPLHQPLWDLFMFWYFVSALAPDVFRKMWRFAPVNGSR